MRYFCTSLWSPHMKILNCSSQVKNHHGSCNLFTHDSPPFSVTPPSSVIIDNFGTLSSSLTVSPNSLRLHSQVPILTWRGACDVHRVGGGRRQQRHFDAGVTCVSWTETWCGPPLEQLSTRSLQPHSSTMDIEKLSLFILFKIKYLNSVFFTHGWIKLWLVLVNQLLCFFCNQLTKTLIT